MTLTDQLLVGMFALLVLSTILRVLQHAELLATLNALAEMIGEEIDRRKHEC